MRYPDPRYNTYKVAKYLHSSGGASVAKCADSMPRMTIEQVRDSVHYMRHAGMIDVEDGVYTVKPYLARWFDMSQEETQEPQQVAAPREYNVFASPHISKKNLPSPLGLREGSNDFRKWPSRHT